MCTSSTRLRLERTEGHFILATQKAKSWKFSLFLLVRSPEGPSVKQRGVPPAFLNEAKTLGNTRTTHPHTYTCSSSTRRNLWLITTFVRYAGNKKKTIKHVRGKKKVESTPIVWTLNEIEAQFLFLSVRLKNVENETGADYTCASVRAELVCGTVDPSACLFYTISPPRHPTRGTNNTRRSGIVRPFLE